MRLEIRKYGDPVLQRPADIPIGFPVSAEVRKLITDMFETMYVAGGVGLAANQIGESHNLAVVNVGGKNYPQYEIALINPTIVHYFPDPNGYHEEDREPEGCLSLPGFSVPVYRPKSVLVEYYNTVGEKQTLRGDGFLARALCHEIDHLEGRLILSRCTLIHKRQIEMYVKKMRRRGKW